jgi:hypothetical protein
VDGPIRPLPLCLEPEMAPRFLEGGFDRLAVSMNFGFSRNLRAVRSYLSAVDLT